MSLRVPAPERSSWAWNARTEPRDAQKPPAAGLGLQSAPRLPRGLPHPRSPAGTRGQGRGSPGLPRERVSYSFSRARAGRSGVSGLLRSTPVSAPGGGGLAPPHPVRLRRSPGRGLRERGVRCSGGGGSQVQGLLPQRLGAERLLTLALRDLQISARRSCPAVQTPAFRPAKSPQPVRTTALQRDIRCSCRRGLVAIGGKKTPLNGFGCELSSTVGLHCISSVLSATSVKVNLHFIDHRNSYQ
ncbi:uncharacterized protein LOC129404352 [Sorex araneus]|uniref:uncharacterized protein LOC129404352 n=1 Tax=Sorex araneus TaxID=42254 RepID=UPI002433F7B0|nr:uncharacterized protein LOC129404352 [Sorex araneus]